MNSALFGGKCPSLSSDPVIVDGEIWYIKFMDLEVDCYNRQDEPKKKGVHVPGLCEISGLSVPS